MRHPIIRVRFLLLALLFDTALHVQADTGVNAALVDAIVERLDPRPLLIVGELHGSEQAPALAAALVERLARQSPVRLGLEVYAQEQSRIDAYLASNGDADARAALLAGEFWHRPRESSDGRRSRAMFALIEDMRAMQRGGASVDVVAFDDTGFYGAGRDRNALMAARLRAAQQGRADTRLLVLTGNYHARMRSPTNGRISGDADAKPPTPMAMHLADITSLSIDVGAHAGASWVCLGQAACGPRTLSQHSDAPPATAIMQVSQRASSGYDLRVMFPRLTVSEPMAVDQRAEASGKNDDCASEVAPVGDGP